MMRSCLSISKPSGGGPVGQPSRRYPTVRYTFLFLLLDEKCNLKKSRYLGERRSLRYDRTENRNSRPGNANSWSNYRALFTILRYAQRDADPHAVQLHYESSAGFWPFS